MIKKDVMLKTRKKLAGIFESKNVKNFIMTEMSDQDVIEVIKETVDAIKKTTIAKKPIKESKEESKSKKRTKKTK